MSKLELGIKLDELDEAVRLLKRIYRLIQRQNSHLNIHYNPNLTRKNDMVQITDIQSVNASVAEVDAVGNPVVLDPATVSWSVSDASILALTQNADGSATLKAVGPLGSAQVSVTAGDLSAQDTVNVVNSAATALAIKFDTPV